MEIEKNTYNIHCVVKKYQKNEDGVRKLYTQLIESKVEDNKEE
ncbi:MULTISPECIES: hypothetical protein [Mammaliicoccus]|nr:MULTISPECIES: hypothetical protein [Mammaliicoccus]